MNNQIKNYGFIEPEIKKEDWILGGTVSAPSDILQPASQWDNYLPVEEIQNRLYETQACTLYGTHSAFEILMKRKFGGDYDFSERYGVVMTETDPYQGNDPSKVIETIRKISGVIDEKLLPSMEAKTLEEYYSPKPMEQKYIDMGKKWLDNYVVNHEWVNQKDIKTALQNSPLGVAVYAWVQDEQGYYFRPEGERPNHWVVCYGYEEGKYFKIFDSYDNTHKQLRWDYKFDYIKRYYITKITIHQRITLWKKIIEILRKLLKI